MGHTSGGPDNERAVTHCQPPSSPQAFETLTGNYVFKFMLESNGMWKRYDLVHPKEKTGQCMLQPSADQLNHTGAAPFLAQEKPA